MLALLDTMHRELSDIIDSTASFEGREPTWVAVDLGHARHDLGRVISHITRANYYKQDKWVARAV